MLLSPFVNREARRFIDRSYHPFMTTPIADTASGYFGAMVESYDSLIRRAVPRYEEMTQRLIDYLARMSRTSASPRILELGCGTGNLTLRLAATFPQARITTVDAAPEMIELSRNRLTGESPAAAKSATFVTSRFEDLDLDAGSFDIITSCISLHHVEDKTSLYRRVFSWLAPGGTFRFADQLRGGTPANHEYNWAKWLEFCRMPGHCTEVEVQSLLDHAAAHDHYAPLHEHFALLQHAGFTPNCLDCVWRNLIWGIVTADK